MKRQLDELLAEIQSAVLCLYISDLPGTAFDFRAVELIQKIPEERYTLDAWNAAVFYITGKPCSCQSVREAKKSITK